MKKIAKIFFVLSIVTNIVLLAMIISNGILPKKYRFIFLIFLIAFEIVLFFLLKGKKSTLLIIEIILAIFSIFGSSFASYYIYSGINAINNINKNQSTEEIEFSLVVLKESEYKDIKDIKDELIYTAIEKDSDNIENYKRELSKKNNINLNFKDSKSYVSAASSLINGGSKVILLNEAYRSIINDQIKDFDGKTRIIDSQTELVKLKDISKNVSDNSSFNVYISGIDTYGALTKVSRSDVNLIVSVNPKNHKMLITTIPRDSYVNIAGGGLNQKDKLTHAGLYGIESSVNTLENLFGIDINYYARVNFSTFMKVIDILDGVDIYNDQAFETEYYDFPLGNIHLDGENALVFVRERYHLNRGDLDRGKNQEKVLKAMIEKSLSPSMLLNYNDFLDILIQSTDTNIPKDKIIELINNQIDSGESWTIDTIEVTGKGQMGLESFAMPGANLYMHVLDEESVENVSNKIKDTVGEN